MHLAMLKNSKSKSDETQAEAFKLPTCLRQEAAKMDLPGYTIPFFSITFYPFHYFIQSMKLFQALGSRWKAYTRARRGPSDPGGPEDGPAAGPGGRGHRDHAQERGERAGEGQEARRPGGAS